MPEGMNAKPNAWVSPVRDSYRVLIAWLLAPMAVVVILFPQLDSAALVIVFAAIVALGLVGARRHAPPSSSTSGLLLVGLVVAPSVLGYAVSKAVSMPMPAVIGACVATIFAAGSFVAVRRRAS